MSAQGPVMAQRTSVHLPLSSVMPLSAELAAVRAAGFDGVELPIGRLGAFFGAGGTVAELLAVLDGMRVTMLDVLMPIEVPGSLPGLVGECERWAALAAAVGCPAMQVVALDGFPTPGWPGQRAVMVTSLKALARVAQPHGVRLGLEPVCFSPFRSLEMANDVIDAVNPEACGLVLDTWHLWVTGTSWSEVAGLDRARIVTVQVGDCHPRAGSEWSDSDRTAYPGHGLVPVTNAVAAVSETGYQGFWSAEMEAEAGPDGIGDHYRLLHRHLMDLAGQADDTELAEREA